MERSGEILVLGIDPGTSVTGWGLVARRGSRMTAQGFGAWRSNRSESGPERLAWLADRLAELLEHSRPDAVAIEQAFFGKNVQSALRLGEARGALLAVCARSAVFVAEYPTARIKKAIVGNGRADKSQVQFMLQRLLGLAEAPSPLDASDALAAGLALAVDWGRPGAPGGPGGPSAASWDKTRVPLKRRSPAGR